MFLLLLLLITIIICGWFYLKLTFGICKCSKHMVGKVVIVTGGNAGIGYETAKDLADRGARVILACRSKERGNAARDKIIEATGNTDVHCHTLDLASLTSVRTFAAEILKTESRIDVLINNAGIYGSKYEFTEDGFLLGMQSNHFGPFLLTNLLLPLLKSSAPSRIINVSSMAHGRSDPIDFKNLNAEKETKDTLNPSSVYCTSKLCNVLFTVELERRLKGTGVTAYALHPGVVGTSIISDVPRLGRIAPLIRAVAKTPWEGAQTMVYLSVAPEVVSKSGLYFRDCRQIPAGKYGQDKDTARELWDYSEKVLKLK